VMIKHNKKKMTKGTIKSMEEKGDEWGEKKGKERRKV
jgi:hypothetical protein